MENDYVLNIIKTKECKICFENVEENNYYCNCSGTIKWIHKDCLLKIINNNKNKIENINLYRAKFKCNLCDSYIFFNYYKKKKTYYILILSLILFIIFSILYFIYIKKYLFKLFYIFLYIIINSIIIGIIYFNLKNYNLLKSYIHIINK